MTQNMIERNIRFNDYHIYTGKNGGYHPTQNERIIEASNRKPTSEYEELKRRGMDPFASVINPSINDMPHLPISSSNSSNQIRNYLDTLSYRLPRKRVGTSNFQPSLVPGRSVGGVNRAEQQKLNSKISGIYLANVSKEVPKLLPIY